MESETEKVNTHGHKDSTNDRWEGHTKDKEWKNIIRKKYQKYEINTYIYITHYYINIELIT